MRINKGEAIVSAPWAALITHELSTPPLLLPAMALLRNATRLPTLDALASSQKSAYSRAPLSLK